MENQPVDTYPVSSGESPASLTSRRFTYYFQDMNGRSDLWTEMLNRLKRNDEIVGAISDDGTVVWSENAPSYTLLLRVFQEQQGKSAGSQLEAKINRFGEARITVYAKNDQLAASWEAYLTRCGVDPSLISRGNIFAPPYGGE